jgi:hypothetical protein
MRGINIKKLRIALQNIKVGGGGMFVVNKDLWDNFFFCRTDSILHKTLFKSRLCRAKARNTKTVTLCSVNTLENYDFSCQTSSNSIEN